MFNDAINELNRSNNLVGDSQSFQTYIKGLGLNNIRTAHYISINSLSDLQPELKDANCMVFRLGSPKGERNTHFALSKTNVDWSDYFLIDSELFNKEEIKDFDLKLSKRLELPFKLLPALSETSLVNLSLGSGLLFDALKILKNDDYIIPSTVRSTFTFNFKPLSESNKKFTHNNGQVEIDSMFVAERNNKECLFVVEAKVSDKLDSLSKHKLLYPILAVENKIHQNLEVIPVYIRIIKSDQHIDFNIVECKIPRDNKEFGALDELVPHRTTRYRIYGY